MAFSLHNHFLQRSGREHIKSFKEAWEQSDKRMQGLAINNLVTEPSYLAYKYSCMLGTQSEQLLRLVPRPRVQFIIFDDLLIQSEKVLSELLEFLELPVDVDLKLPHDNQSIKRHSLVINRLVRKLAQIKKRMGIKVPTQFIGKALDRLNAKQQKYDVEPQIRNMLVEHFTGEIHKIFEITGTRHQKWLE
jgi:hypothetical protein